ncbi:hypothetical protein PLESTF_000660000, partial [Pleodorina starrii]
MEKLKEAAAAMKLGVQEAAATVQGGVTFAKDKAMATAADVAERAGLTAQGIKDNIPIMPEGQTQQPSSEAEMWTKPEFIRESYVGADKLLGRVALITGGDSGIGRSVAVHYARE